MGGFVINDKKYKTVLVSDPSHRIALVDGGGLSLSGPRKIDSD
jgi:hypothetical protein